MHISLLAAMSVGHVLRMQEINHNELVLPSQFFVEVSSPITPWGVLQSCIGRNCKARTHEAFCANQAPGSTLELIESDIPTLHCFPQQPHLNICNPEYLMGPGTSRIAADPKSGSRMILYSLHLHHQEVPETLPHQHCLGFRERGKKVSTLFPV